MTHRPLQRIVLAWTNSPLRVKGLVVVAIPLIAILVTVFAYSLLGRLNEAAEAQILRTERVRDDIWRVENTLANAESGVREYLLDGDREGLKLFDTAQQTLPDSVVDLSRLVRDTPAQSDRMPKITHTQSGYAERFSTPAC